MQHPILYPRLNSSISIIRKREHEEPPEVRRLSDVGAKSGKGAQEKPPHTAKALLTLQRERETHSPSRQKRETDSHPAPQIKAMCMTPTEWLELWCDKYLPAAVRENTAEGYRKAIRKPAQTRGTGESQHRVSPNEAEILARPT